jgi:hypothetical protein
MKVFTIDAMSSNSMKSSNPHSGIHETQVAKCLDTMCLDPSCNQGGHMVLVYDGSSVTSPKNWNNPQPGDPCYALHTDSRNYVVIAMEGNGARPSHMGKGYSEDGKMYTLNTIEQHSVCYSVDCRNLCMNKEVSGTLQAKNVGGFSYNYLNPVVYAVENHPNDSRVRIDPDGIVQTLSSRMGTGGNNTPLVLLKESDE